MPETMKMDVEFLCGFCLKKCGASSANSAIVHELPMCPMFDGLEPDEFMAQSRQEHARNGRLPDGREAGDLS